MKLLTKLLTRPLVFAGEKAWPCDLAALYERLKQDVSVELPAGMGSLVIGAVQPEDVNTVWFRFTPAGNFVGVFVYIKGVWQNTSTPVGTITWRKGRPDQMVNGKDGWWVCDGENGTLDMKAIFQTLDGTALTGGNSNKTFNVFWATFKGSLATLKAVTTPVVADIEVALETLYDYMKATDECSCDEEYDPALVTAFLVEFKGVQNA